MGQPTHIESLLAEVEALAPHFGRARGDIEALVRRARDQDHKGVLQNTRLVVETLLRAIVAKKKQTPGRQTLDQLVSKLQSDLPTHIAVHVRTIQAWGNVSAHDHGAGLDDAGLEVSEQEVTAALNALVPILKWYRDTHVDPDASAPVPAAAVPPRAEPAPEPARGGTKAPMIALAAIVLGALGYVFFGSGSGPGDPQGPSATPSKPKTEPKPTPEPKDGPVDVASLNDFYAKRSIPLPPEECRPERPELLEPLARAGALLVEGEPGSKRPEDEQALRILSEDLGPERLAWGEAPFLQAQAMLHLDRPLEEIYATLDETEQACVQMTEAYNLHGKLLFKEGKVAAAIRKFKRSIATGEGYGAPWVNLALAYMQKGDEPRAKAALDELLNDIPEYGPGYRTRGAFYLKKKSPKEAVPDLEKATALDPKDGKAWVLLGRAYLETKQAEKATGAFCEAKALGVDSAQRLCDRAAVTP